MLTGYRLGNTSISRSKARGKDDFQLKTRDSSDFVIIGKEEEEKNNHFAPKISPTKISRAMAEKGIEIEERKMQS